MKTISDKIDGLGICILTMGLCYGSGGRDGLFAISLIWLTILMFNREKN